jgi:hypothetical protein
VAGVAVGSETLPKLAGMDVFVASDALPERSVENEPRIPALSFRFVAADTFHGAVQAEQGKRRLAVVETANRCPGVERVAGFTFLGFGLEVVRIVMTRHAGPVRKDVAKGMLVPASCVTVRAGYGSVRSRQVEPGLAVPGQAKGRRLETVHDMAVLALALEPGGELTAVDVPVTVGADVRSWVIIRDVAFLVVALHAGRTGMFPGQRIPCGSMRLYVERRGREAIKRMA